jgi:hypothetical protein
MEILNGGCHLPTARRAERKIAPGAARRYEKGGLRAREGRKMSAISFSFARSGLANLLPATGGSPRCLRQLGSPPAIFLLPLRGYIAPRCAGQAKATPSRRGRLRIRSSRVLRVFPEQIRVFRQKLAVKDPYVLCRAGRAGWKGNEFGLRISAPIRRARRGRAPAPSWRQKKSGFPGAHRLP